MPDSNPFAEASSIFSKPDWQGFSGKSKASSVVTAEDLVGPDGTCAGSPAPAAAPQPAAEPEPPATDGANPRTPPAPANEPLLQPAVGLALGLSECDVVQRAGNPDQVDVGKDERGERSVVMTYTHGERAGIYRFREGRLFTIERVAVVEEPKKPVKPKAPAKKPVRRAAKPAPASSYADPNAAPKASGPAWPAPPQQKPAGQAAPWPSTPAQRTPQSTVWPAPPAPPSG